MGKCLSRSQSKRQSKELNKKEESLVQTNLGESTKQQKEGSSIVILSKESVSKATAVRSGISPYVSQVQDGGPIQSAYDIVMRASEEVKEDVNNFLETYNTPSSIIKMPDKKRKKKPSQIIQPPKKHQNQHSIDNQEQIIEGTLSIDVQNMARFSISNKLLYMQFMLPKCSAGPLIVPYINYDYYISE